jgi:hypothetical protein
MKKAAVALIVACSCAVACTSPEAKRTRGGGPGADVGNKGQPVEMHEGSRPFWKTPEMIKVQHPPLEPARQADQLSDR